MESLTAGTANCSEQPLRSESPKQRSCTKWAYRKSVRSSRGQETRWWYASRLRTSARIITVLVCSGWDTFICWRPYVLAEEQFNKAMIQVRVSIEWLFGILCILRFQEKFKNRLKSCWQNVHCVCVRKKRAQLFLSIKYFEVF